MEISDALIEEIVIGDSNISDNFQNILNSYKMGNHVLAFEKRGSAKKLIGYYKGQRELENIIYNIYQNHQDNVSLKKILKAYVRIKTSNTTFSKYADKNNVNIFEVPINFFSDQLSRTSLVTENTEDGYFYKGIADRMKNDKMFGLSQNIVINCSNDAGGGSQTSTCFRNKAQIEKRVTFSICDSDKTDISSPLGATAKNISKISKTIDSNSICDFIILNVREKENLLPPSYYCEHGNYKYLKGLNLLKTIENDKVLIEKIKYLKISDESDDTLKFFEENFKEQIQTTDYSVGKSGCSLISKEFIYTESYLKSIQQNFKKNKEGLRHYEKQYASFFEKLPESLVEEYLRITLELISWSCSFPKPRLSY